MGDEDKARRAANWKLATRAAAGHRFVSPLLHHRSLDCSFEPEIMVFEHA